jgi:hypothetical protein
MAHRGQLVVRVFHLPDIQSDSVCISGSGRGRADGDVAKRLQYIDLDGHRLDEALVQSTAAAVVACSAVWATLQLLRAYQIAFVFRLLPPLPLAMMFMATVCNIIIFSEALYLRAHKQEKFMLNSIAGALWMVPTALFLGRWYGAFGVAAAYLCGSVFIGLGLGTYTFAKYRRLWHAV